MKKIIFTIIIFVLFAQIIYAHPGRTDSSGCHTCKSNCSSWGLSYGQYHCHGASSSPTKKKSSTKTLSSLKINGKSIKLSDNMKYTTTNQNLNIVAKASNSKASVNINTPNNLNYGENIVTIKVTAEDSSIKTYNLIINLVSDNALLKSIKIDDNSISISDIMSFTVYNEIINLKLIADNNNATIIHDPVTSLKMGENIIKIIVTAEDKITKHTYILKLTREEPLNNDSSISLKINGETLEFENDYNKTINLKYDIDTIDIDYLLGAETSYTNLNYDKNLKVGKNEIKFKVTAEDGSSTNYLIIINRDAKPASVIEVLIVLGMFAGIPGYIIYRKKKKEAK